MNALPAETMMPVLLASPRRVTDTTALAPPSPGGRHGHCPDSVAGEAQARSREGQMPYLGHAPPGK